MLRAGQYGDGYVKALLAKPLREHMLGAPENLYSSDWYKRKG
jgi:hypothetical protein